MNENGEHCIVRIYPDALLAHCYQSGESAEVTGARLILCCIGIEQNIPRTLPNDDRRLAKWVGISGRRWQKIKSEVVAYWRLHQDGEFWQLPEPSDEPVPRGGIV